MDLYTIELSLVSKCYSEKIKLSQVGVLLSRDSLKSRSFPKAYSTPICQIKPRALYRGVRVVVRINIGFANQYSHLRGRGATGSNIFIKGLRKHDPIPPVTYAGRGGT